MFEDVMPLKNPRKQPYTRNTAKKHKWFLMNFPQSHYQEKVRDSFVLETALLSSINIRHDIVIALLLPFLCGS